MAVTKIGKSQFDIPAPLGYRRFANAMIIFILPGMVGLVQGWGMSDRATNRWLMFLAFIPALIKGIGTLIGNGQEYTPSNQQVDIQNAQEKEILNNKN